MKREQLIEVFFNEIELTPMLRRSVDEERLAGLVQSILEVGLLYPPRLTRHGDRYLPADGFHRILAGMKLGWKSITAYVEENPLGEGQMLQQALIANTHRVENTPLERAEGIARLKELTGWSASTIAEKLGYSNATVSRLLSLLELPEPIREQVHRGDITLSAACELARVGDGERQAALAADVAGGRLTRDALGGEVRALNRPCPAGAATAKRPARVTAKLGDGRAVSVSGEELDLEAFITTLEEVLARARKARNQGIEVATFVKMLRDQAG
ncbi:ParB/RepB/Spo0J family partition protein [Tautonia sp. JC769]|uniref:ParB/RepB/Spo0J family partition protein n=1 Tax=Tautonia sp. JC769 TaxID=3232135 RepID=UPI00345766F6